jgi:SPP1 gp7 family putative phage head morphogenesis protein
MSSRFNELSAIVRKSIVDNDALGIGYLSNQDLQPLGRRSLAGLSNEGKIEATMFWLEEQERRGILEITRRGGGDLPWMSPYIQSSYAKGLQFGNAQLRKLGISELIKLDPENAAALMNMPFHADRVAVAINRNFEELEDITVTMNTEIRDSLALGLAQGQSPMQISAAITGRIDKIGKTRGDLLARTETVFVHNRSSAAEYERSSLILGEPVHSEWQATLDGRARPTHMSRHGKVFRTEDAVTLLGEPNCRCAILPYVPSIEGEVELQSPENFRTPGLKKRRDIAGNLVPV